MKRVKGDCLFQLSRQTCRANENRTRNQEYIEGKWILFNDSQQPHLSLTVTREKNVFR